jgi:hypothetical protein
LVRSLAARWHALDGFGCRSSADATAWAPLSAVTADLLRAGVSRMSLGSCASVGSRACGSNDWQAVPAAFAVILSRASNLRGG